MEIVGGLPEGASTFMYWFAGTLLGVAWGDLSGHPSAIRSAARQGGEVEWRMSLDHSLVVTR